MMLKERIKEILSKDSLVFSKPDNLFLFLADALGKKVESISTECKKMLDRGELYEIRKGKYIVLPSHGFVKGKFIGNAKGYGFCEVEGFEDDIFIPGNMTSGAIDGDEVVVKVFSTDGGKDGQVFKVVKPVKTLTGRVVKISKNLFLEPDNPRISFKISILKTNKCPLLNQKVVVRLVRRPSGKVSGEVIEVLGDADDVKSLELAIIREHNLYEQFPDEAEALAKKLNKPVTAKQKAGRLDLTKTVCFTIDGEDAKDFDDAVSISALKDDGFELGVHIADVGEFVKKGNALDEVAFERGTSTYFPTSVLPMLPVDISNGICSLNEGVERLTLSCIMKVDKEGKVFDYQIKESVIKSSARLTYTQVYAVMQGKADAKAGKFKKQILLMARLAKILQQNRQKRGALDLDIAEPQFVFDENGYVVGVEKRERNDAHRLIEEFMVLANETVAKHYALKQLPFVYRVHEKPTNEKIKGVLEFLNGLRIACPAQPKNITPSFVQKLLDLIKGKSYEEAANKIVLRSLQKALYKNQNLGHFGLALEYYCHFTSPIRRYPDLTIHRFIKDDLHGRLTGEKLEEAEEFSMESAEQSSVTERNSEKAEREVDDLWRAYLMKDHVGETFDATVVSVTNYGIFVGLDNSVEGLIRIENLPTDGYLFFERSMELKGQKHTYKIGDRLKVKLISSNIFTRKVDFVPAN